jgi:hypothetical protein
VVTTAPDYASERTVIRALRSGGLLAGLTLFYLATSLLHFAHNAEYLGDYPNLPVWLTRAGIYLVWVGQTALGIIGYVLHRRGWQLTGLCLLAVYAAFGFDGLLHYTRAPIEAHSAAMNFTIWFEVVAAAVLLLAVLALFTSRLAPNAQRTVKR